MRPTASLWSRLGATAAAGVALAALGWSGWRFLLADSPAPSPSALRAAVRRGILRSGDRDRAFAYYVPRSLNAHPFLIVALHGARGSGRRLREQTGYQLDVLADGGDAVVVYPDGVEGYWHDCRRDLAERQPAATSVDDVAFLLALVAQLRADFGVTEVFAMGFSNGGEMAYRWAFEQPETLAAIATVAANLPTAANSICTPPGRPMPALIVAGTDDPINPYAGGASGWFGFGKGGPVESATDTAAYFSRAAGYDAAPPAEEIGRGGATWVERTRWEKAGAPEVALYVVHGGGHTIPQPYFRFRRLLGRTDASIDGVREIWNFFTRSRSTARSRQ